MHVHQQTHINLSTRCDASTPLLLPVQILAQCRLDDALVRHPAMPFVFDPGNVAPKSAVLLGRQPE